jgi:hypothetical protein
MLFTDFVSDVEIKFLIGNFCIAFVGLHLIVNTGIIGFYSIMDCRKKLRHRRWKKMHAKRVQDNLAAKLKQRLKLNLENNSSQKLQLKLENLGETKFK